MDSNRFDGLTRQIATAATSRQRLLRLAAGAGLATAFGLTTEEPAAAQNRRQCRRNGSPCIPGNRNRGNCCSGSCRRLGASPVGRCRPRPAAKGCTIRDDSCDDSVTCPQDSDGRCFTLNNGLPFCATRAYCFRCRDNDHCNRRFNRSGGRCLDNCSECSRRGSKVCIFA
jgi:hypothetical protein